MKIHGVFGVFAPKKFLTEHCEQVVLQQVYDVGDLAARLGFVFVVYTNPDYPDCYYIHKQDSRWLGMLDAMNELLVLAKHYAVDLRLQQTKLLTQAYVAQRAVDRFAKELPFGPGLRERTQDVLIEALGALKGIDVSRETYPAWMELVGRVEAQEHARDSSFTAFSESLLADTAEELVADAADAKAADEEGDEEVDEATTEIELPAMENPSDAYVTGVMLLAGSKRSIAFARIVHMAVYTYKGKHYASISELPVHEWCRWAPEGADTEKEAVDKLVDVFTTVLETPSERLPTQLVARFAAYQPRVVAAPTWIAGATPAESTEDTVEPAPRGAGSKPSPVMLGPVGKTEREAANEFVASIMGVPDAVLRETQAAPQEFTSPQLTLELPVAEVTEKAKEQDAPKEAESVASGGGVDGATEEPQEREPSVCAPEKSAESASEEPALPAGWALMESKRDISLPPHTIPADAKPLLLVANTQIVDTVRYALHKSSVDSWRTECEMNNYRRIYGYRSCAPSQRIVLWVTQGSYQRIIDGAAQVEQEIWLMAYTCFDQVPHIDRLMVDDKHYVLAYPPKRAGRGYTTHVVRMPTSVGDAVGCGGLSGTSALLLPASPYHLPIPVHLSYKSLNVLVQAKNNRAQTIPLIYGTSHADRIVHQAVAPVDAYPYIMIMRPTPDGSGIFKRLACTTADLPGNESAVDGILYWQNGIAGEPIMQYRRAYRGFTTIPGVTIGKGTHASSTLSEDYRWLSFKPTGRLTQPATPPLDVEAGGMVFFMTMRGSWVGYEAGTCPGADRVLYKVRPYADYGRIFSMNAPRMMM